MKPGETELTQEQLQLAYRHLARPTWPTTLQAALDDPLRGPAIRGLARQLSRQPFNAGRQARLPSPPVPDTPTEPPPRRQAPYVPRARKGAFDARRAAANDFDD